MIAIKERNTKIVAVPNPYYDLLLINTSSIIDAKSAVKNEVQADRQIKILVDNAPRVGTIGTRFSELVLRGTVREIRECNFFTAKEIPATLLKAFDKALLTMPKRNKLALSPDDWAQLKAELAAIES